ncbi:MAG: hypothetical protein ACO3ZY_13755, partial [Phycisphaerales bacterium]
MALVAGGAVGAKATAIGFVALPLGLLLLASMPPRRWLPATLLGCGVGILTLAPWLWHNTIETGQPFFPLFAKLLGGGAWTDEQIAIFSAAHAPDASPWRAFLDEALLHGLGPTPVPGEPWRPQWSLLWPLGLAAIGTLLLPSARRPLGWRLALAVAAMLLFCASLTHLESRFLVPAAVPLALAIGLSVSEVRTGIGRPLLALAVLLWSLVPVAIFLRERPVSEGDRWGSPAAAPIKPMPMPCLR